MMTKEQKQLKKIRDIMAEEYRKALMMISKKKVAVK